MNIKLLVLSILLPISIELSAGEINYASYPSQDSIKSLIKNGKEQKDFNKLALGYYYRAITNIGPGIKTTDLIEDFNQSAIYYKFLKDTLSYHKAKLGIAKVHTVNESFLSNAEEIIQEALNYSTINDQPRLTAECYTMLGKISEIQLDFDKAINYVESALQINRTLKDSRLEIQNNITIIKLLISQRNLIKTEELISKTFLLDELSTQDKAQLYYMRGISQELSQKNQAAKQNYLNAIDTSIAKSKLKVTALLRLSKLEEKLGNLKSAYNLQNEYLSLNNEIINAENQEMLQRLVTSYETKEQERKIEYLEEDQYNRQKQLTQQRRLLYTLGAAMLAILVSIFYIVRFYSDKIKINQDLNEQREKIQNQEINALENQVKINNLEAMVHGQEIERNRIAQDLHDSLGGMLSAVKLQFDALHKEDRKERIDDQEVKKMHQLIDDACEEVRDVARNLKPVALENMGLEAAIRDLVNRYSSQITPSISFFSETYNREISFEAKLHLYRIVQELINNALKHAQAAEIDIQLYAQDENLSLSIEDDGVGFDQNTVKRGLGLNNIKSRLAILNGIMEVESSANGNGTSIFIKVPFD